MMALLSAIDPKGSFPVYHDMMQRFDARCAAYLTFPGQALTLPGQIVFRFD